MIGRVVDAASGQPLNVTYVRPPVEMPHPVVHLAWSRIAAEEEAGSRMEERAEEEAEAWGERRRSEGPRRAYR